jgi:hypothetical protein
VRFATCLAGGNGWAALRTSKAFGFSAQRLPFPFVARVPCYSFSFASFLSSSTMSHRKFEGTASLHIELHHTHTLLPSLSTIDDRWYTCSSTDCRLYSGGWLFLVVDIRYRLIAQEDHHHHLHCILARTTILASRIATCVGI